jgi:4-hydroxythreonine-4-phosphate dehydrogenase
MDRRTGLLGINSNVFHQRIRRARLTAALAADVPASRVRLRPPGFSRLLAWLVSVDDQADPPARANQADRVDQSTPTIAVSMGDPLSIGPEVVVKALSPRGVRARARVVIFGSSAPLEAAAERAGIEPFWWRVRKGSGLEGSARAQRVVLIDDEDHAVRAALGPVVESGPTKQGGAASFQHVEDAIAAVKARLAGRGAAGEVTADALVTAPISKEAWSMAGRGRWPGHTELLADRFNAKCVRMCFASTTVRVALATAHLPLMDVRNVLTIGRVFDTIDLAHRLCVDLGVDEPRIAVAGLNPHAGEGGALGDEERRLIEPAISHARQHGIDAHGPFPGDTVFRQAVGGVEGVGPRRFDIVVAMYHDQGLIPVKLLAFEEAVNVSVGLPAPRTSPDHGTAFDIAGKNIADAGSMSAAVDLAITLAQAKVGRGVGG